MISLIGPKDFKGINRLILEEFPYTEKKPVRIEERVKEKNVFVFKIKEGNEFAGFIDCSFALGVGIVHGLAVVEKFRGKGLGKTLLIQAVDFLRSIGAAEVRLLVSKKNNKAKGLYANAGFLTAKELGKKIGKEKIEEMVLFLERKGIASGVS